MPNTKEEEKKALPIVILVGLGVGGLVAWLLKRKQIEPDKAILYGSVTDIETQQGIGNINVECDGYIAKSDSNGDYMIINLPPGTYSVTFTDPAGRYQPMTI